MKHNFNYSRFIRKLKLCTGIVLGLSSTTILAQGCGPSVEAHFLNQLETTNQYLQYNCSYAHLSQEFRTACSRSEAIFHSLATQLYNCQMNRLQPPTSVYQAPPASSPCPDRENPLCGYDELPFN